MTCDSSGDTRTRQGARVVGLAVLALAVLIGRADAQGQCSTLQQNLFVRDVMTDIYLWRTEIPNLDPSRFASPEEYLDAIRYKPLDATFSYIAPRAEVEALFSNSEYVGFGLSTSWRGFEMVISQVFPGGPAADAGLRRGDVIVEINGRTVQSLIDSDEIGDAFGPSEAGVVGQLVYRRDQQRFSARLVKREVIIPTVSDTRILDVDGRKVGYIFFRNFVEPSVAALDLAFNELRAQGATELVLDLRYNGGGLVSVAQHLASLIGGALTNGQVFAEYSHNERNVFRNRTLRFEAPDNAWRLNRLFVITTRGSASASELVINSLRPFIPVVIVGDRTYGKPVGQYVIPFCDRILAPVSFSLRNASGQGDFFEGLPATCAAADDLSRSIGDAAEASLSEAIYFIRNGACSGRTTTRQRDRQVAPVSPRAGGWLSVLGTH